jgi:hypothetical protein
VRDGQALQLALPPPPHHALCPLGLTGNLTLDAQGDPNAVFIFQTVSSLDTAPGSQVILSGRANAANIYWQVGTAATLGTTSTPTNYPYSNPIFLRFR